MGLDGISVNQLRLKGENTSKENAIRTDMLAQEGSANRSINSLDKKGAIDTGDKENTSFFASDNLKEDEDESEDENTQDFQDETGEKLDLNNKEVFEVSLEVSSNSLTIYNKKTDSIVQKITPHELSTLVDNLKNPGGIIVNKRI